MDRRHEGAWAERVVARRLRRAGWRILARNRRIGGVEVDILARRDGRDVLWEVKRRRSGRYPALSARQHGRLSRAAEAWALLGGEPSVGIGLAVVEGDRRRPRVVYSENSESSV